MTTIIVYILSIIIIGGFIFLKPYYEEYKSMKRTNEYYDSTYLRKQGGTSTYGDNGFNNKMINYDLRSWDGGKNWYVTEYNFKTNELKIVGESETIYPGLIKHLESWDKLTEYVSKNGPIDPHNVKDIKILKDAGFTVKTK